MVYQMRSVEKSRLPLQLSFLVGLILLLLPNVFPWINDELIHQVGGWFGYKMLLTIPLILLLVIAYQRLSHRLDNLSKSSENPDHPDSSAPISIPQRDPIGGTWEQIQEHRDKLLRNLASDEKELLRKFIDQNKRTMTLDLFAPVPNGLVKQDILVITNHYPDYKANYMVSDWAWDKLKTNSKILK
jgi:hypothetical protein